jgi:hypothetical protein
MPLNPTGHIGPSEKSLYVNKMELSDSILIFFGIVILGVAVFLLVKSWRRLVSFQKSRDLTDL